MKQIEDSVESNVLDQQGEKRKTFPDRFDHKKTDLTKKKKHEDFSDEFDELFNVLENYEDENDDQDKVNHSLIFQ